MSFWKRNNPSTSATPPIRLERSSHGSSCTGLATRTTSLVRPGRSQGGIVKTSSSSTLLKKGTTRHNTKHKPEDRRAQDVLRVKTRQPAIHRLYSDSDDDEYDSAASFEITPYKTLKVSTTNSIDADRRVQCVATFDNADQDNLIHSVNIADAGRRFAPAFGSSLGDINISLSYPGGKRCERYALVYCKDEFDPVEEIIAVARDVADYFLAAEYVDKFRHADHGILRRLERARNLRSLPDFRLAVEDYNAAVDDMIDSGAVAGVLSQKRSLTLSLTSRISRQVYDRTVSPHIETLKKYENGTDFIYGELRAGFMHNILAETGIKSDSVFVDLGSGVANLVLQAALQIGCESWGCEIMENACTLAQAQKMEFEARSRLWGLEVGAVNLERGDFMTNSNIRDALRRADLVVVNNEVFTPQLNNDLVHLFLDLKDGCRIVSLKSFVPPNHKITRYNLNNPVNLLDVKSYTYSSGEVSWKDDGGQFYIAVKDSNRLREHEHLV